MILLGGRSWRVTGIEWSRKTVWLEPAKEGGKARWMGGARSLSRDVCQGIRQVLAAGPPTSVTLSRRASASLQSIRDDLCIPPGTHFVMSRPDEAKLRTWTFAGTRANRTLARFASSAGEKVKFDAISIQAPATTFSSTAARCIALTDEELQAFAQSIKFSSCLPRDLLERTISERAFEEPSQPG